MPTDNVQVKLARKINGLSTPGSKCCIFRVHNHLREVNEKAYEPELVSIGPYHRGKVKLQGMEEHKLRYLQLVLNGNNENLKRYVSLMRSQKEKARKCYAEPVRLDEDEFVEMLILDSCFVVELMRKYNEMWRTQDEDDIIFKMHWMLASLRRDLMLFENQLPYFVIEMMFGLIHPQNENSGGLDYLKTLKHLALTFFSGFLNKSYAPQKQPQGQRELDRRIMHLLDLIHESALPLSKKKMSESTADNKMREFLYMPCASKLVEAGVKFKKDEEANLFNITFKDGVLTIPHLRIEDRTDSIFRNLIAFEQYIDPNSYKIVSEYAAFMDRLIDTPKDVEILTSHEIVDNWLGEDEVISNLFNKIVLVTVSSKHFHYADICFNLISWIYKI